ncbi:hypothetical protein [Brevundimonas sp.]|uniref:hypothetical protein n=1 Tax=Brevundimonas sp. TaxID=1871086 RepID=UPI004033A1F4
MLPEPVECLELSGADPTPVTARRFENKQNVSVCGRWPGRCGLCFEVEVRFEDDRHFRKRSAGLRCGVFVADPELVRQHFLTGADKPLAIVDPVIHDRDRSDAMAARKPPGVMLQCGGPACSADYGSGAVNSIREAHIRW